MRNRYLTGAVVLGARPAKKSAIGDEAVSNAVVANFWKDSQDKQKAAAAAAKNNDIGFTGIVGIGVVGLGVLVALPYFNRLVK